MASVVCVGLGVLDSVYSIEDALEAGTKNFASGIQRVGGGPAANAAVTVASLGGKASFISVLGDDDVAGEIIDGLAFRGVSTGRVRRKAGCASPQSVVITTGDGERTIVNRTDARLWDGAPPIAASDIAGAGCVLVDLRWRDGAISGIDHAAQAGIPAVVDFDVTDIEVPESVLKLPSHVIFSEPALLQLTGQNDPERGIEAVETGSGFAAVTLGGEGVVWRQNGQMHHMPAFDVDVVSTLGAGDVFHGAFALGLAEGLDTNDNMRRSAAAAALMCARGGGREGIPSDAEVQRFLEEDER